MDRTAQLVPFYITLLAASPNHRRHHQLKFCNFQLFTYLILNPVINRTFSRVTYSVTQQLQRACLYYNILGKFLLKFISLYLACSVQHVCLRYTSAVIQHQLYLITPLNGIKCPLELSEHMIHPEMIRIHDCVIRTLKARRLRSLRQPQVWISSYCYPTYYYYQTNDFIKMIMITFKFPESLTSELHVNCNYYQFTNILHSLTAFQYSKLSAVLLSLFIYQFYRSTMYIEPSIHKELLNLNVFTNV